MAVGARSRETMDTRLSYFFALFVHTCAFAEFRDVRPAVHFLGLLLDCTPPQPYHSLEKATMQRVDVSIWQRAHPAPAEAVLGLDRSREANAYPRLVWAACSCHFSSSS